MSDSYTLSWFAAITPEICLLILIVAVFAYDRVAPTRRHVGLLTAWGAFITLLITMGLWIFFNEPRSDIGTFEALMWGGMIRHDLVTLVFRVMFLTALLVTSLISLDVPRLQKGEYYGLLVIATMGFSLMGASADLIMVYIALETASVSSYILAGFNTKDLRSSEAGMKYFVYGAFATGLMLYGMSLMFGITGGQTNLYVIGQELLAQGTLSGELEGVFLLAALLVAAGFGFKISAVPFHFWTPDVYEGAPTPFTSFVSTASKAAGFAVFTRVFLSGSLGALDATNREWWAMLVAICIVTMTLGNLLAIFQTNIKRLLAYSSIAQAGYALIGLVTLSQDGSGATMFYLLMYVFTNAAAFGVIILFSNVTGSEKIEDLSGLSRRSPYLALAMLFALLSLGGIPPTAGFVGKFFIFKAAVDVGLWWLALIGILNAFIALYYYLNIIKVMYLYRSDEEDIPIPVSRAAQVGLAFSVFWIIALGVYAGPAFEWTRQAAAGFFLG